MRFSCLFASQLLIRQTEPNADIADKFDFFESDAAFSMWVL